jgi:hypothetical protein
LWQSLLCRSRRAIGACRHGGSYDGNHLDILNGQDRVLAMLDNFASKDMPGRQAHIQDCADQILAKVDPKPAAS